VKRSVKPPAVAELKLVLGSAGASPSHLRQLLMRGAQACCPLIFGRSPVHAVNNPI